MEWKDRAQLILEKIRRYRNDEDGWKISKKSASRSAFFKLFIYYLFITNTERHGTQEPKLILTSSIEKLKGNNSTSL